MAYDQMLADALAEIERLGAMCDAHIDVLAGEQTRHNRTAAERDALSARLAAAEKVVEAAGSLVAYLHNVGRYYLHSVDEPLLGHLDRTVVAVDAYRTHEPEPEQT
jgi:hypothetical protein